MSAEEVNELVAKVERAFGSADMNQIKLAIDAVRDTGEREKHRLARELMKSDTVVGFVDDMLQTGLAEEEPAIHMWLYEWYQSNDGVLKRFVVRFVPSLVAAFLTNQSADHHDPRLAVVLVGLFNMSVEGESDAHVVPSLLKVDEPSVYHTPVFRPDSEFAPSPPPKPLELALHNEPPSSQHSVQFLQQLNDSNASQVLSLVLQLFVRDMSDLPLDCLRLFCKTCERLLTQGCDMPLNEEHAHQVPVKRRPRKSRIQIAKKFVNKKVEEGRRRAEKARQRGSHVKKSVVKQLVKSRVGMGEGKGKAEEDDEAEGVVGKEDSGGVPDGGPPSPVLLPRGHSREDLEVDDPEKKHKTLKAHPNSRMNRVGAQFRSVVDLLSNKERDRSKEREKDRQEQREDKDKDDEKEKGKEKKEREKEKEKGKEKEREKGREEKGDKEADRKDKDKEKEKEDRKGERKNSQERLKIKPKDEKERDSDKEDNSHNNHNNHNHNDGGKARKQNSLQPPPAHAQPTDSSGDELESDEGDLKRADSEEEGEVHRVHIPDDVLLVIVRGLLLCAHVSELAADALTALKCVHTRALVDLRERVLLCTTSVLELVQHAEAYTHEREPNNNDDGDNNNNPPPPAPSRVIAVPLLGSEVL